MCYLKNVLRKTLYDLKILTFNYTFNYIFVSFYFVKLDMLERYKILEVVCKKSAHTIFIDYRENVRGHVNIT